MVLKKIVAFIVIAVALGSSTAQAADQGGYFGIGLGQTNAKDFCSSLDAASIPTDSCDAKDTGVKLFGGYQFSPYGAIELGYVDLGKIKATGSGASLEFKAKGFDVDFVGALPINDQFAVLARVGMFFWNVDTALPGLSDSSSGNDLTYGLGVRYDVSRNVSVRFEWQQFKEVGDDSGIIGASDVALIYASMVFRF